MLARAWQSAATLFFLSHTHKHKTAGHSMTALKKKFFNQSICKVI